MAQDTVIVAGAGPVGVMAALALAKQGLKVTVVEADPEPNMSPRAVVYLHPLLPDLDRLGILADMKERGHVDREGFNLHVVALGEVLSAPFEVIDDDTPTPYNLHLGQGEFTTLVSEHLARLGVDVRWGNRVTDLAQDVDGVTVTVETPTGSEELRAAWLVGADGGRSAVRELIGASLDGFTWDERFVATNLRADLRSRGFRSSNLYIHPTHACVIADIDGQGLWRCTFQESDALPEEGIVERIGDFYRGLWGADFEYELVDYRPYRMHQRLASKLRDGRVVLIGDAAHLTNPTGGLGLTTGLYDVLALEEVLPAVAKGEVDEAYLDLWAAERSRVFSEVSSPIASGLKRVVYGGIDVEELREATQYQRTMTATREGQREMLLSLDSVRSPSILAMQP
ncbi:MAG TPA: FAD-dependent oxidoreductase [Microbacteriaceae bacterium]|nr:FAD-dependent oxidoreductase [Microbacteriaceae bacterium]